MTDGKRRLVCPLCRRDVDCLEGQDFYDFIGFLHEHDVHLPKSQCRLLYTIKTHGRPAGHDYLIDVMYGADPSGGPDDPNGTIKVQISKLRKALHESDLPWDIETIWGVGYEFVENVAA